MPNHREDTTPDPKFTADHVLIKHNLRRIRLCKGLSFNEAAALIGISRKLLETCELIRASGQFLEIGKLLKIVRAYDVPLVELFYPLDEDEIQRINDNLPVEIETPPCSHCGSWDLSETGEAETLTTFCMNCYASAPVGVWAQRYDYEREL